MKCTEFRECVCEIVDRRLPEERANELMQHAHSCPHCDFEYRSLQAAKDILHEKVKRESVPPELYYSIVNATINSSGTSWIDRLFGFRLNPVIGVIAFLVIAVGAYSFFTPSHRPMPEEANIITQSLKNYQAVIGGSIKPQLVSTEENVRSFLAKEVPFDVIVPKMKGCSSCAGVLSSFNGIKLAHVVMQVQGKDIIYIYQASMKDAMNGSTIGLPDDVMAELKRTDWYVRDMGNNTTLILWRNKNTLCSAVSAMKKDEMLALLSNEN